MYRNFYIIKSSIELFLFGILCLAIFLNKDEYLLIISAFIILTKLILSILRKYKFNLQPLSSNKIVQMMAVTLFVISAINSSGLIFFSYALILINEVVSLRRVMKAKSL